MKNLKKILALMMAMAMVLGMNVTSFASQLPVGYDSDGVKRTESDSPASGTKSDTGSITISNVTPNPTGSGKTVSVTAYKIIEANYGTDGNGKFSGYKNVYPNSGIAFVNDTTGRINDGVITEANLATIRNYITGKDVVVKPENQVTMKSTDGGETYTATGVGVGTYLVVISGAEGKIYSNMVVSVQYVNDEGSANYVESADLYLRNGMALAKVQENPTIKKEIIKVNGADVTAEEGQKKDNKVVANSANVGDVLQFKITATIPDYSGKNPVFKVTDDLTGLTYKYDESKNYKMSVNVVGGEGTPAPITNYKIEGLNAGETEANLAGKNQIVLNFVDDSNNYVLKGYADKTLEITYYATVDATAAKYNKEANENTVKLEYTHNSNVSGDNGQTPGDTTKTYTFDLSGVINGASKGSLVNKKDGVDNTVALGGAEFKLYQKAEDGRTLKAYTNDVMTEKVGLTSDTDTTKTTKVVSSNGGADEAPKGAIVIRGLAAGTYYLKETKAPEGYSLSDKEYTIVVAPVFENGELASCTITVDGEPLFSITKEGSTPNNTPANGNILNTKLSELPSTGGIGTTIFTIGGCAIMILAAGLYFASRRKAAK